MAFLDNSGDIILDAVLTDLGRLKMAQGSFRITKFALGDDEIDYALYNVNTGSAYTDLEILQTPIFEAFTQTNANINYGLVTRQRADLLYIPELLTNHKLIDSAKPTGSVYYLATNSETSKKLSDVFGSKNYEIVSDESSGASIVIESLLNTNEIAATEANQRSYILNNNLFDGSYEINVDTRFIAGVLGPTANMQFSNAADGTSTIRLAPLVGYTPTSRTSTLSNYSSYNVPGVQDRVFYYGTGTPDTDISAGAGPRGSVLALNFIADPELKATSTGTRSNKFVIYGNTDNQLFGGSDKYDYIDMTAYVTGKNSGANIQLPIRIIRYAGT